jgi:hypothetical protein
MVAPRSNAEPALALDRAGITVFRDMTFFAAGPASEGCRSPARPTGDCGMNDSFTQLRRVLTEAAKLSFSGFKEQNASDNFYAFGLMSPDCLSGDPVASPKISEESGMRGRQ